MKPRKAILISNPKTGRYASRRLPPIEDVYTHLTSAGLKVELVATTGPGDATRIAADAARKGVSEVIVAGGDGTIETNSRMRYLYLLSHAMRSGMPAGRRGVHFLRVTRARATGEAAVQVDGELIGNLPMTFEIAPEAIEVIVP